MNDDVHQRRGVIPVWGGQIAQLLALPEHMRVVAIDARNNPVQFEVIVESPELEIVPPECCAPFVLYPNRDTVFTPNDEAGATELVERIVKLLEAHDLRRFAIRDGGDRKTLLVHLADRDPQDDRTSGRPLGESMEQAAEAFTNLGKAWAAADTQDDGE